MTANHLALPYSKIFPDSKIGKNFECRGTKTTTILNEAMYPSLQSNLVNYMAENTFSMVNDGLNDSETSKMNLVCVCIFNIERSKQIKFKFYSMCSTTGKHCSKSKTIFDKIDSTLISEELDWDNIVAVSLDKTNSNMGDKTHRNLVF